MFIYDTPMQGFRIFLPFSARGFYNFQCLWNNKVEVNAKMYIWSAVICVEKRSCKGENLLFDPLGVVRFVFRYYKEWWRQNENS